MTIRLINDEDQIVKAYFGVDKVKVNYIDQTIEWDAGDIYDGFVQYDELSQPKDDVFEVKASVLI